MSLRIEQPETAAAWPRASATTAAASTPPIDIAAVMLECILRSRGAQRDTARTNAEHAHALLERARHEIREAMERAERAEQNGDFWSDVAGVFGGDIASIAGLVGAVSLAVATGGAGTPAIMALVGAGLTAGAKLGQELGADPRLTAAMSMAGGVLGLFAGNASGAGNAWTTVGQVGTAVQGGASGVGGTATIVEGHYRGTALDERADAEEARSRQNAAWLRLDLAIAEIDQACRDVARAQERATSIERTESDGARAIIARIGAA